MKTAMSDDEYWERCAIAALMGLCANRDLSNQWMTTPEIAAYVADQAVRERSARLKKQHGMQEE